MSDEEKPKLTRKQQVFIDEYLLSFNATGAAKKAGYSEKTAHAIGWENLRKPEINEQIQSRLAEVHMSADEALKLLADMARGDLGEFMNDFGGIDISQVRKIGKTALIKKWKTKTVTINGKQEDKEIHTEEIELHDPQSAIDKIFKVQGKYINKVDVTSGGEKVKGYVIVNPDDWDKEDNG